MWAGGCEVWCLWSMSVVVNVGSGECSRMISDYDVNGIRSVYLGIAHTSSCW